MENESFTITSFASAKKIEDRLRAGGEDFESDTMILAKLSALAVFLDRNGLATRRLTDAADQVDETFVLTSDDLSPLGLQVIRKGYQNWLRAKQPDVRPLEKALRTVGASPGL